MQVAAGKQIALTPELLKMQALKNYCNMKNGKTWKQADQFSFPGTAKTNTDFNHIKNETRAILLLQSVPVK